MGETLQNIFWIFNNIDGVTPSVISGDVGLLSNWCGYIVSFGPNSLLNAYLYTLDVGTSIDCKTL